MAKRTDVLELAVLGLLQDSPLHGYELRKRLSTVLGSLRAFSYGSLYPCLKQLLAAGLIAEDTSAEPGRSAPGSRPAVEDRLQADGRGQGAPAGPARRERALRLGGRRLRRALRLLRADRRRDPAADPRGPAVPARGADGRLPGRLLPHPRAARQLHPRAAQARPGERRARGALALRADRRRAAARVAGDRVGPDPPTTQTAQTPRRLGPASRPAPRQTPRSNHEGAPHGFGTRGHRRRRQLRRVAGPGRRVLQGRGPAEPGARPDARPVRRVPRP